MLNSAERLDYICGYMAAYENKIKMANKQGLFDAAKMFELFAANVCTLWFGQSFKNLNTETSTYPYVDLISEDKRLFVQVTTTLDLVNKVKKTLEKLRDSKDPRVSNVNNVVFFVLHNDNVDRVPDYAGSDLIGNIPFTRKNDLISTQDILARAQNDLDFQLQLYDLFKADESNTSRNEELFKAALESTATVGLMNINCYLSGGYQIDRTALLEKVKSENYRFISIQGTAGSGKSAFCKLLVDGQELVLYARSERFIEESNLNDIWSLDIEKILIYLNGRKLTFFIDALEFIADCRQTKFELLQQLYTIAQKYENVYIVTSCRSSEKGAFIKLETNLGIHSYTIDELSDTELSPIADRYPTIKKMLDIKAYQSLLRIPFYINFILEQDINPDDVHDEIAFRDYIWENIICLRNKAQNYKLKYNEIVQTVNSIVFERAKQNLLGIREDKFDSQIIKALVSEGILVSQKNSVRLKHDTFEDICFEKYFDEKFIECRGNYQLFYSEIEDLGKCVYRRYQIWISNKLFGSADRSKFLYHLIFADSIPQNWKKQTEIGITKSKHCTAFFREQGADLVAGGQIWDFVKTTNLFAFDVQILFSGTQTPMLSFYPIGNGRPELIRLIYEYELFKKPETERTAIKKLCLDYSKQGSNNDVAPMACSIAAHYVDRILDECLTSDYYHFIEYAGPSLTVIYRMPNSCHDWITLFLDKMSEYYESADDARERIARDTILWTMKNAYPQMVTSFTKELCALFETYWTHDTNASRRIFSGHYSDDYLYGLNEAAERYNHEFRDVDNNPFFINLFGPKLFEGFDWAINFVNRLISKFAEKCPDQITNVEIYFPETKQTRTYLGNPNMWLISIDEYRIPTLISDIIYILNRSIINHISAYLKQDGLGEAFAKCIKDKLYSNSNNIALLTIVENIGMHFHDELPGYALELASSLHLIHWDIHRYTALVSNPTRDLLEKQIMRSVGIPSLNHRYKRDKACECLLRNYVFVLQFRSDNLLRQRCHDILDYLYAKIESDKLGAEELLQVQKMDARNAEYEIIGENQFAFSPHISGEAAEYMNQKAESGDNGSSHVKRVYECIDGVLKEKISTQDVMEIIEETLASMNQDINRIVCENPLIMLIAVVFNKLKLDFPTRSKLCNLWIDGIRRIFSNGTFAAEAKLSKVLFEQINSDVSIETKNNLKLLILDLLLYKGNNGLISEIAHQAKVFLSTNEKVARSILNTIIMLAKDEMDHQKYNADYLENHPNTSGIKFVPNVTPKLAGVDRKILEKGSGQIYPSQRDAIIAEYLYGESELKVAQVDMADYDLVTMSRVSNCGLKLRDPFFNELIGKIVICLVESWHLEHQNHRRYSRYDVLDSISESELVELFRKQIIYTSDSPECAINLLFDKIDFSLFTEDTISFYLKILGHFLPAYIDAWQNPSLRGTYKAAIKYLEEKVNRIQIDRVRIEFYKLLFFYDSSSFMSDFSKCPTEYSYADIIFLNEQFSKYGVYHPKEMFFTVYQLGIDKLLPNILLSINNCFNVLKTNSKRFPTIIKDNLVVVKSIIYKAFIVHSTEIKLDHELTSAYENILETLVELNYEDAAVLLDEFRLH